MWTVTLVVSLDGVEGPMTKGKQMVLMWMAERAQVGGNYLESA